MDLEGKISDHSSLIGRFHISSRGVSQWSRRPILLCFTLFSSWDHRIQIWAQSFWHHHSRIWKPSRLVHSLCISLLESYSVGQSSKNNRPRMIQLICWQGLSWKETREGLLPKFRLNSQSLFVHHLDLSDKSMRCPEVVQRYSCRLYPLVLDCFD
jgi:hypothetical protein